MKLKVGEQCSDAVAIALLLALACVVSFFWHLGTTGLVDETEPLFAIAARQMVETGNWITPYYNGETRFDKPPLIYWAIAVGYRVIGTNEWAVRLPSALSGTFLVFGCWYTLWRFGGASPKMRSHSAAIGGAAIALCPQLIVWARTGVSDALLCATMGGALLCFFLGYGSENRGWYWGFYLLTALAVLTKGPVGVVLPGLIIAVFLLYLGRGRSLLEEMQLLRGSLLFLAVTLPWYIGVIWQNGRDYIDSFFGYHNFERFTRVVNDHSAPWYFYFLVVLVGFAPLSVYLPGAIWQQQVWRRRFWQQQPRSAHLGLFAVCWSSVIFLFFTVAVTKLPSYVLPLMPAAAILVALFWSQELARGSRQRGRGFWLGVAGNIVLLLLLSAVVFYSPHLLGEDTAAPDLPEIYARSGIALRGSLIWLAGAIAVAIAAYFRSWRPWLWSLNLIVFAVFFVLAITPAYFLMDEVRQAPLRQLAEVQQQVAEPGEMFLAIGHEKPTLVFYTGQKVKFFQRTRHAIQYLENQDFHQQEVLVISHPEEIDRLQDKAYESEILATRGAYQLLRMRLDE